MMTTHEDMGVYRYQAGLVKVVLDRNLYTHLGKAACS